MPLVGDLMRHDQMRLGIDTALNTIADMPAVLRARRHGACIGVGQRYLPVRRIGQGLLHSQQALDLFAYSVMAACQMRRALGARRAGFLPVNPVGLLYSGRARLPDEDDWRSCP